MQEKKKKLTGQQGELMRALDITMDDLIANDEGYITEEHQESILKGQDYQYQQYNILAGVFTFMSVVFAGIASANTDKLLPLLFMGLFFLVVGLSSGGYGVYKRRKVKAELASNHFETVQGIAVVNVSWEEAYLEINGLKLNASPDILRRVQHLQPYIIHYLPGSKVILSMQHIEENSNIRESSARLEDNVTPGDTLDYGSHESARYSGSKS